MGNVQLQFSGTFCTSNIAVGFKFLQLKQFQKSACPPIRHQKFAHSHYNLSFHYHPLVELILIRILGR